MIYIKRTNTSDVKSILKWLRERGVDFDFIGGDIIEIEFENDDLEQEYLKQWGEGDSDTEPVNYRIDGWQFTSNMSEIFKWLKQHGRRNVDYDFFPRMEIGERPAVDFKFYNKNLEQLFVVTWYDADQDLSAAE
jgi:hypothetical protein